MKNEKLRTSLVRARLDNTLEAAVRDCIAQYHPREVLIDGLQLCLQYVAPLPDAQHKQQCVAVVQQTIEALLSGDKQQLQAAEKAAHAAYHAAYYAAFAANTAYAYAAHAAYHAAHSANTAHAAYAAYAAHAANTAYAAAHAANTGNTGNAAYYTANTGNTGNTANAAYEQAWRDIAEILMRRLC